MLHMKLIQDPTCSVKDFECVNSVEVDTSSCLKHCSGLIVTSFSKSELSRKLDNTSPMIRSYEKYKKITLSPVGSPGKSVNFISKFFLKITIQNSNK